MNIYVLAAVLIVLVIIICKSFYNAGFNAAIKDLLEAEVIKDEYVEVFTMISKGEAKLTRKG